MFKAFRSHIFLSLLNMALVAATLNFSKLNEAMGANLNYAVEIQTFRDEADKRWRSPEGWLSVVGLSWLKEGDNFVGSANENSVVLPKSVLAQIGKITLHKKSSISSVTMLFSNVTHTTVDGEPAKLNTTYKLKDDSGEKPTQVKVGSVTFFAINRKNGIGIRVKDENSEARKNFQGRKWFPVEKNLIIDAEWVAFDPPHKLMVPDILGNLNEETSPGFARFNIAGQKIELHPTLEDDQLFFVFRDQTSGKETYGAARFLNTSMPKNGRVILDFNKAVNPPCSVTHFATCPLPPPENIMKVAIRAGELKPSASEKK